MAAAGAAALGGAVGSIAGQGVGMALGNRDSFSWREVAMSAVGSAIGSGVGQSGLGQLTFGLQGNGASIASASAMARSAITSSALKAVSLGAGSQGRFSWRAVAASAVGAGVGAGMGAAFGAPASPGGVGMTPAERFGELARGTVYSIAAGSAASAIGSGRVMARQVAVDAFGNALGNGLAEMSGRGSTSGPRAASGGFPLYAANQVGTTMNDAGPDIDPRPRGGLEDVTVTARRLGADDEVKVYYGDRLIQSFFDNTPTGRAVSGFGEAASAWIDRNRAEYNQYYDSRLRDASSPMSTALARTGRALSNAPFDLGAGAVGLYTLATDRNVQARTLSAIGGAVMNPVSTASGALGATRSYLANTSLPQMAEDVTRVAAGAALPGGLGRLTQVTTRVAIGNTEVLLQTGGRQVLNPSRIEGWDAAERAYGSIRADRTDIAAISQNTGMPEATIKRIKGHVFENVHLLDSGLRRFDADPNIVNSWSRLQQGDFLQSDLGFLAHERFEAKFEALFKTSYRTAHDAAERSGRVWKPE